MFMLKPVWKKNDRKASRLIISFSILVFTAVVLLNKVKLDIDPGFDVHFFALINAMINSWVAILMLLALWMVKNKRYEMHKRLMLTSMCLSILFLISYICHHLLAGDTRFGDINHDGIIDEAEKSDAGSMRIFYYIVLVTHIPLAGLVLPFILFTAYRALIGEYPEHKRLARITWPVWFYVALSGVVVYLLISPYY
jgi:putative membrane protein